MPELRPAPAVWVLERRPCKLSVGVDVDHFKEEVEYREPAAGPKEGLQFTRGETSRHVEGNNGPLEALTWGLAEMRKCSERTLEFVWEKGVVKSSAAVQTNSPP